MQDKAKINRILAQLEDIKLEVESMLPTSKPAPVPGARPAVNSESMPESEPDATNDQEIVAPPEPESAPVRSSHFYEPSAMDRFWEKIEDWFCVRGDFAPKGMTREFAVATRWLTRVGAVLIVGAIAYFLMLAIDKGWIGPAQRVYGMMTWGVVGTVYGTWLRRKSEKYAILGEVCAAVGLVAAYLSFGLGHRYFKPPVIVSGYIAFTGLFAATVAAGFLSVRLKSLMIAGLALAGGFLVPTICSFTNHDVQLHLYLLVLSLGACAVAHFRGWTIYALAAIAVSALFSGMKCCSYLNCDGVMAYLFHAFELALFLAMTIRVAVHSGDAGRKICWAATPIAATFCLCKTGSIIGSHCAWDGAFTLHYLWWTVLFAALAVASRRRNWGGTPVLLVFSFICAVFAMITASVVWWRLDGATVILLFCAFTALLAEIGVRSREKTLQCISFLCVVAISLFAVGYFVNACHMDGHGYMRDLLGRMQYLWPVPALVAFVGWRLGVPRQSLENVRLPMLAAASGMAFWILTAESHFFGREFLPFLRGGFVTMVWAVVASALLAVGIVRRLRMLRLAGLGVLAMSVVKLLLVDTSSLAMPGRVGVFAAVGVLLIVGAFLYLKFKSLFEASDKEPRQLGAEGAHNG